MISMILTTMQFPSLPESAALIENYSAKTTGKDKSML